MATAQRPTWRRIYRQTITLIHKNFLIFYKTPISTLLRALLFPLAVTLVFSFLVRLNSSSSRDDTSRYGIATSSTPLRDLGDAIRSTSQHKLVFVRNGIPGKLIDPIVSGIKNQTNMDGIDIQIVEEPDSLFKSCKQTLRGTSDCFAAVVFFTFNNTDVEYSIALDESLTQSYGYGDFRTGNSTLADRIFPLQWAIDSHISNFSTIAKPSTQPFSGYFGPHTYIQPTEPDSKGPYWLSLVKLFVAPVFILILIGVVYHLATFVATERESSMSELMAAQNVTATPRIMSTMLSFYGLYFPGFLICSVIMTSVLFKKTSDILFLVITLLAGGATVNSAHFVASFFGKAQLAGLYTSTLVFALALVTLSAALRARPPTGEIIGLSIVFPPAAWANFIGDVAMQEYALKPFSLSSRPDVNGSAIQKLPGYLYIVFFIVQIVGYLLGTYAVERTLWGVTRKYDKIDASSDVALRCTGLTKTYKGKRRWYFPFLRIGKPVVAINKLDLEVKKGSVTFLLGPNGGGKTTSLKCIAGMTSMDSGSHLELNEGGVVFGICPQTNVFWENLTVQEHIKIWRKLKTAAYADLMADDDDVVAECDLLEKIQAPAKTLSGGQMRKLQLAIAFVGGSKVCCIDEASSGLDPLSRRNIWNIIQKGHTRRTVLLTTHFLDEADVLADHIAIVYKGKLVCEGPGTSLKARYGESYVIRSESDSDNDSLVWRTSNSAEATRKILELETLSEDQTYNVVFPTLEQVFLKVTSESHTAIHDHGGDGIVGEEETSTVIDEKIAALDQEHARDIELDVGHSIGILRQIVALFRKRFILLTQKAGWISYGINIIIPIIIASALVKFMLKFNDLQTCHENEVIMRSLSAEDARSASYVDYPVLAPLSYYSSPTIYSYNSASAYIGPKTAFDSTAQNETYADHIARLFRDYNSYSTPSNRSWQTDQALNTRAFVDDSASIVNLITNASGYNYGGFGIFSPTPQTATLFYSTYESSYSMGVPVAAFGLITDRIGIAENQSGHRSTTATLRGMRHAENSVSFLSVPISVLLVLAFIAASSIAVIYPAYEKNNRVRALEYCNGVSPFALWTGYLMFDMQFIIVQAFFVWGLLFSGSLTRLWYEPSYVLGAFILFGIATYLGTYVLSLYTKKAAFAIAAGIHVLLMVLYFMAYIVNQVVDNDYDTFNSIQYGFGLASPGGNLLRALFLASNGFEVLCGKYGTADTSNPFTYDRYGSVYANFFFQILFLIGYLMVYEYGSADWFRRHVTHRGVPSRLHYIVEADAVALPTRESEKHANAANATASPHILDVSKVSKFFGKNFAVENVSFDISANQTLALLGGNGAGKTTVINMIRGELKPNFGDIFLDGISVLRQPHRARLQMGVCPQDDAVDNLTVRQTLTFYATVKGLKNISGNVDKVLEALNITMYEDNPVKALSGGTKRKLSVAIALLGNPRILLLDEPSTGQDAGAKRILWKALQSISANRAILLTTHSMEEAEALATNVAIMGTKMLAKGTLTSLQETYGGAYSVRAVRVPTIGKEECERVIKENFQGSVSGYTDSHGQISFALPHDKNALGSIMRIMEGLKGDVVSDDEDEEDVGLARAAGGSSAAARGAVRILQDYTITGPTLEEVFMNVARESGVAGGV